MVANGNARPLDSFEDVEEEFIAVRRERADDQLEVMGAIGQLTREVSGVRREVDEVRRAIVERSFPPPRHRASVDDTGSHNLVEAWQTVKHAAEDPRHPMTSDRARALVEETVERLRASAELSTWRRIKALLPWAGREAGKVVITIVTTLAVTYVVAHMARWIQW